MKQVENRETKLTTYTLTTAGLRGFMAEREKLQATRRDMLAQLRYSRDSQASEIYDYATNLGQLRQLEAEIARVEAILHRAAPCGAGKRDAACVGSKISLQSDEHQLDIMLVDSVEADPFKGRISIESPLGHAVAGSRVHEIVEIRTLRGVRTYSIAAID
jgi:transcription elongation factor GreA